MNLKNYYYYFNQAIPTTVCDDIVKYAKTIETKVAGTGYNGQVKDLSKLRDSNIVWLNDNWIYNEIWPYLNLANKSAGWDFQWDVSESCQFTIYKPGQFYDWHCDEFGNVYDRPNTVFDKKIRKISCSLLLSDPEEYKGGELEFDFKNQKDRGEFRICTEVNKKGSIIFFPSFVWHRVKPVTKGTRYSLVIWSCGNPYR